MLGWVAVSVSATALTGERLEAGLQPANDESAFMKSIRSKCSSEQDQPVALAGFHFLRALQPQVFEKLQLGARATTILTGCQKDPKLGLTSSIDCATFASMGSFGERKPSSPAYVQWALKELARSMPLYEQSAENVFQRFLFHAQILMTLADAPPTSDAAAAKAAATKAAKEAADRAAAYFTEERCGPSASASDGINCAYYRTHQLLLPTTFLLSTAPSEAAETLRSAGSALRNVSAAFLLRSSSSEQTEQADPGLRADIIAESAMLLKAVASLPDDDPIVQSLVQHTHEDASEVETHGGCHEHLTHYFSRMPAHTLNEWRTRAREPLPPSCFVFA